MNPYDLDNVELAVWAAAFAGEHGKTIMLHDVSQIQLRLNAMRVAASAVYQFRLGLGEWADAKDKGGQ